MTSELNKENLFFFFLCRAKCGTWVLSRFDLIWEGLVLSLVCVVPDPGPCRLGSVPGKRKGH